MVPSGWWHAYHKPSEHPLRSTLDQVLILSGQPQHSPMPVWNQNHSLQKDKTKDPNSQTDSIQHQDTDLVKDTGHADIGIVLCKTFPIYKRGIYRTLHNTNENSFYIITNSTCKSIEWNNQDLITESNFATNSKTNSDFQRPSLP